MSSNFDYCLQILIFVSIAFLSKIPGQCVVIPQFRNSTDVSSWEIRAKTKLKKQQIIQFLVFNGIKPALL
jgi:hypothetical protein